MFKDFGVLNKNSLTDRLYHLSFDGASAVIAKMEDNTRQIVLKEIDGLKLQLNEQMCLIDVYTMEDGYPRPLCQMNEYMFMASMIKRLDILISMLCDVNDALEEHSAYNTYDKAIEFDKLSTIEKLDYLEQCDIEGIVHIDTETAKRDIDAVAGAVYRMKNLADTSGQYSQEDQDLAARLTKSYFEKKLKIDHNAKDGRKYF